MSDVKLLPCPNPWCRHAPSSASVVRSHIGMEYGFAFRCECGVIGPQGATEAEASAAWNTRPADPAHAALRERLEHEQNNVSNLREEVSDLKRRLRVMQEPVKNAHPKGCTCSSCVAEGLFQ